MALALFADDDYEEVAARLTDTLESWGWWDDSWSPPTSGGLTQARQRLGWEVVRDLFRRVAAPVAQKQTLGAFLRPWRLMGMDGFDWDTPDTTANAKAFGYAGSGENRSAFCQGASGQHQRVRLPRDGGCGAGPLHRQGQRGAGVGPQALPAPKPGLAAHRRGVTSTTSPTGAPPPTPARSCCGGSPPTCGSPRCGFTSTGPTTRW